MKTIEVSKTITIIIIIIVAFALMIELIRTDVFVKVGISNTLKKEEVRTPTISVKDYDVEKFLVIKGGRNGIFDELINNIEKTLSYIKCDYEIIEAAKVNQFSKEVDYIIVAVEEIEEINNYYNLFEYVFNGGSVLISNRLELSAGFRGIYRELGILEYGDFEVTKGIKLYDDFMINSNVFEADLEELIINSSVSIQRNENTKIWLESSTGVDLYWTYDYGKGRVGYYNGDMFNDKMNRGVLASAINSIRKKPLYPLINSKVIFIDDFPAPVPDEVDEKIYEEFSRNIRKFYQEVWWPDMVEISARQNLVYTGVVIGSYQDKTEDLSRSDILLDSDILLYYGKELINRNGEIGLHGFNHQPLVKNKIGGFEETYKSWIDNASIRRSIIDLKSFITRVLEIESMVTYVPPSNILDEESRKILIEEGILVLASLYLGATDTESYIQEFEIKDNIVEFPRFTSGYDDTPELRWIILNGINLHGVVSHFVHPDDVFDPNRSQDDYWSVMYDKYVHLNQFISKNYRWIESLTASDAARNFINYNAVIPIYEIDSSGIKITSEGFLGNYFIVAEIEELGVTFSGCTGIRIDSRRYLIEVKNRVAEIIFANN